MTAVAVEALGCIGVAQLVDLAVIGSRIRFQAPLMAVAAVLGNRELGGVLGRILDVVGGVAVGADRGARVLVLQHFLSMHRRFVLHALCLMALAAGIRNVQAPLLPLGAAVGIDVVGIVAVIAACVGMRLVVPVRPRVD